MADIKLAYTATSNFTLTLTGLTSSATAGRESTAISNTTNLFEDAIVQVGVTLQAGTPGSDKAVYIYAYGSSDGTNYTDNATGSDAAITLRDPTNLRLANVVYTPDSGGLAYKSTPFSIARLFGGVLPPRWGIVVRNYSNVTLHTTEASHFYKYLGAYRTVA